MSAHDVTPNRSVLLDLKRRIKLTQGGYKILKMKRDGLIIEFFEVLEKARKMREGVSSDYESAMEKITIARAVEGEIAVKSAAYALKADPQVKLGSKSIMGMMVPKVEAEQIHTKMTDKGYGVISTSAYIEDAAAAFEKLLDTLGLRRVVFSRSISSRRNLTNLSDSLSSGMILNSRALTRLLVFSISSSSFFMVVSTSARIRSS